MRSLVRIQGWALACVLVVSAATVVDAFVTPDQKIATGRGAFTTRLSMSDSTPRVQDASSIMRDMRAEMAKNEDANNIMMALRGANLNDDDMAVAGLEMRLVDIAPELNDALPFDYNPTALKAFFSKRPLAILTRIFQLTTVGGGFATELALDKLLGRIEKNPELEVERAAQLRDLITSLGPFFIKIGQALSIRPDLLSPRSMVELQKLCDKVPSYDSKIAFATMEKELGRSVDEVFSEITPEPVAAASLGQVCEFCCVLLRCVVLSRRGRGRGAMREGHERMPIGLGWVGK
jgi:aarF domain-containing kinase